MTIEAAQGKGRAYSTPTLVDYGTVAKLTQGSQNSGQDGGVNGMMASACL